MTCPPAAGKSAGKCGRFLLEHRPEGGADIGSQPLLDRVEPGLPGPVLRTLATLGACAVLGLNFVLLADFFGLPVPFLK